MLLPRAIKANQTQTRAALGESLCIRQLTAMHLIAFTVLSYLSRWVIQTSTCSLLTFVPHSLREKSNSKHVYKYEDMLIVTMLLIPISTHICLSTCSNKITHTKMLHISQLGLSSAVTERPNSGDGCNCKDSTGNVLQIFMSSKIFNLLVRFSLLLTLQTQPVIFQWT